MSKLGGWRLRRWRPAGSDEERPARVERCNEEGEAQDAESESEPEALGAVLPPPDPHVMQLAMGKSFRPLPRIEPERLDPIPKPVPIRPERRV